MSRLIADVLGSNKTERVGSSGMELSVECEQANAETLEAFHEAELDSYRLEELQYAQESLEDVYLSLADHHENGDQLTKSSLEGYSFALRSITGGAFDIPSSSLESIEMGRYQEATELTMEGAWSKIQDILKAIKDMASKFISSIGEMVTKLLSATKKMEKKIDELGNRLGKAEEGSGKVTVPKAESIAYKGKASHSAIHDGATNVNEDLLAGNVQNLAQQYKSYFTTVYKAYKDPDSNQMGDVQTQEEKVTTNARNLDGMQLPGNKKIAVETETDTLDGNKVDVVKSITIEDDDQGKPGSTEIELPSKDDVKKLLETIRTMFGNLRDNVNITDEVKKGYKEATGEVESFAEAIRGEEGSLKKGWDEAKARSYMSRSRRPFLQHLNNIHKFSFKYTQSLLSYLETTVKQHEKGGGKGDKES